MKHIFRISILCLFVLFAIQVDAQNTKTEIRQSVDTTNIGGEHGVGWVKSHILDNWFFGIQAGGNLYGGHEDFQGPIGDHLAPQFEGYIGRWIFPMLGIRAGAGFGSCRGFLTRDSWSRYRPSLGYGASGFLEDASHAPLGGYYWNYDKDDDLLIQQWDYLRFGFDVILNLSNFKDYYVYRPDLKWTNNVYFGVLFNAGICEDHWNYPHTVIDVPHSSDANNAAEGHIGYQGHYHFNKHMSIYGDLRLSVVEGKFDREISEDMEKMNQDFCYSAMMGFNYQFNFRSDEKRRQYYLEHGILDEASADKDLPKFVHFVQVEEIEQITLIDTIVKYTTVVHDDVRIREKVDSLQGVLDSIIYVRKSRANDQPLDSIFLKQLLPYEMVFFELDKWDILPSEEMKIAKMAKIIKGYPNETFILTGSADAKTGTEKRNTFLSHNRADIVYNRLVTEYDVNPNQLKREYLGGILAYDPFVLNRTCVIIMDHPSVRTAFEAMKAQRKAGGGVVEFEK